MRSPVSRVRHALVLTALFGALACDSSTEPLILTEEEAADAFDALSAIGFGYLGGGGAAALRSADDFANAITAINESGPCPNGGTFSMVGEVDETATTYSVDIVQDYTNCVSTSSTERVWTFNGEPNIRTLLNATESTFSGSIKGGIHFSSEGTSGVCQISITITSTGISGKVCGRPIDESFGAV